MSRPARPDRRAGFPGAEVLVPPVFEDVEGDAHVFDALCAGEAGGLL